MSSWLVKTAAQWMISWLPRADLWNELLQRHVTGGLQLEAHGEFERKVKACRRHFDYYMAHSPKPGIDFTVLEIGTGWFPIIPVGLYLCGAKEIWTFDITRLLRRDTFYKVLDYYVQFDRSGELAGLLPGALPERLARLSELTTGPRTLSPCGCLESLGIHSLIGDVRLTGLPRGSIDLIFSHGVLEHFTPPMLREALIELRRVSSVKSVMSNYLGLSDQFASFDRTITPFNFLRYSTTVWRFLNNPLIPQNRLRVSDYRRAFSQAEFMVVDEEDLVGAPEDLEKVKLAPEFRSYDKEDLLVLFSWLIARPAAVRPPV